MENYIRWNSVETEWMNWDAPWENHFIEEKVLRERMERILNRPIEGLPSRLHICHDKTGHVGSVSTYLVDGNMDMRAVGISIPEICNRNQGLGEKALKLWIAYLFTAENRDCIYCETWSGNNPMVRLAEKCGFIIIEREVNKRFILGNHYDGLLFKLCREDFISSNKDYMDCITKKASA
jgi:RimJ/RimL family protein N-acetyltransferase